MQKVRSSYGTFGIVVRGDVPGARAACRWRCITRRSSSRSSSERLPELKTAGQSMMFYMFPFENLITVEFRRYNPQARGRTRSRHVGRCAIICGPPPDRLFCAQVEARHCRLADLRYQMIDGFNAAVAVQAGEPGEERQYGGRRPDHPLSAGRGRQPLHVQPLGHSRKRFTRRCCRSISSSAASTTTTSRLSHQHAVCGISRLPQDRQSLLSYSWDGNVMTIDPVSTANPGLAAVPAGVQPVLQRPRRHPAAEPDAV